MGKQSISDHQAPGRTADPELLQRQRASAALLDFVLALALLAAAWYGAVQLGLDWELAHRVADPRLTLVLRLGGTLLLPIGLLALLELAGLDPGRRNAGIRLVLPGSAKVPRLLLRTALKLMVCLGVYGFFLFCALALIQVFPVVALIWLLAPLILLSAAGFSRAHFPQRTAFDLVAGSRVEAAGPRVRAYPWWVQGLILSVALPVPLLWLANNQVPDEARAHAERTRANMHTLQTMVETYSLDWSGIYPPTLAALETEARARAYWTPLSNPYSLRRSRSNPGGAALPALIEASAPPVPGAARYLPRPGGYRIKGYDDHGHPLYQNGQELTLSNAD